MRILTVRLPQELWRQLKILKMDGKIKSIQQAVVAGLKIIINEKQSEGN